MGMVEAPSICGDLEKRVVPWAWRAKRAPDELGADQTQSCPDGARGPAQLGGLGEHRSSTVVPRTIRGLARVRRGRAAQDAPECFVERVSERATRLRCNLANISLTSGSVRRASTN